MRCTEASAIEVRNGDGCTEATQLTVFDRGVRWSYRREKSPMSQDPDDEGDPPPRPRTRSKSISVSLSDEPAPVDPRTRTRSISIGTASSLRAPEKSRTKTKELPPSPDKTRLVIELDDPNELIGFLEQIVSVLREGKRKRIVLVVEE